LRTHVRFRTLGQGEHARQKEAFDVGDKKTSKKAAAAASDVLKDGRTGKKSKTAAGSALSQTPAKKGKK